MKDKRDQRARPFVGARGKAPGLVLAVLLLAAVPAQATGPALSGDAAQGGLMTGHAPPGSRVTLDDRAVPVAADGTFLLGFSRDAAPRAVLAIAAPDGAAARETLAVTPRDWPVQRIDGLPRDKVTPPPAVLARIRADAAAARAVRDAVTRVPDFAAGFAPPALGPISGVFGAQRILNGRPMAPHSGLDIAAPRGDPVRAAADGTVVLVRDMVLTGKTVMIDHGLGLVTTYAHCDSVAVHAGEKVRRGREIGRVGASGRATGPHLHFGVSWLDRRLDPARIPGILPPG